MLYANFQVHRTSGAGEEDFKSIFFFINGHGGHLGHVTWTVYRIIHLKLLRYHSISAPTEILSENRISVLGLHVYTQTIKFCPLDVYVCRIRMYARIPSIDYDYEH